MLIIPLPPLTEQQRIVAKVAELMAMCDRLEASLAGGEDTRRRLLDALLHEALLPDEAQSPDGEIAFLKLAQIGAHS
jgi:type I restriction enzyme, S subunit